MLIKNIRFMKKRQIKNGVLAQKNLMC
jgi:hypothetical protein